MLVSPDHKIFCTLRFFSGKIQKNMWKLLQLHPNPFSETIFLFSKQGTKDGNGKPTLKMYTFNHEYKQQNTPVLFISWISVGHYVVVAKQQSWKIKLFYDALSFSLVTLPGKEIVVGKEKGFISYTHANSKKLKLIPLRYRQRNKTTLWTLITLSSPAALILFLILSANGFLQELTCKHRASSINKN